MQIALQSIQHNIASSMENPINKSSFGAFKLDKLAMEISYKTTKENFN